MTKVYLANRAWNGEYLELVEQPLAIFYKIEDAESFCIDKFIKEETIRCSHPNTPDIYIKELNLAKENRAEYIAKNILFYNIDIPLEDCYYGGMDFTIIEMEIK